MEPNLQVKLQRVADKLRQLWGDNPDSRCIEEAIALLPTAEEATQADPKPTQEPTPTKTRRKA